MHCFEKRLSCHYDLMNSLQIGFMLFCASLGVVLRRVISLVLPCVLSFCCVSQFCVSCLFCVHMGFAVRWSLDLSAGPRLRVSLKLMCSTFASTEDFTPPQKEDQAKFCYGLFHVILLVQSTVFRLVGTVFFMFKLIALFNLVGFKLQKE